MKLRNISLACAMIAATQLCPAQQQTGAAPTPPAAQQQNPNAATALPATAAIPSYPDSPEGLQNLIKDMLKLQKSGDAKGLAPYLTSLVLPNPDAWFHGTFGGELGNELADSYSRTRIDLPLSFPDVLGQLLEKRLTSPKAVRFSDCCDPLASVDEYVLLRHRANSQPIYDVRFSNRSVVGIVRYFAYVDGAFRYLGSFKVNVENQENTTKQTQNQGARERTAKIPGNVMAAKLIRLVRPDYPDEAKAEHLQGAVILHAIIGENGAVCGLQVVRGPSILAEAAIEAVRQWRYSPTMLNGQPVAVDTTIDVVYDMGG